MKNELLATRTVRRAALALTLGAVLLGSLAGVMPARAGDGPPPIPPLQNLIGDLPPPELPTLSILPPWLFKAELTSKLFVKPVGPFFPHWYWIICRVTNSGLLNSGPFQTRIMGQSATGLPLFIRTYPMNIGAGASDWVWFPLHVGAWTYISSYADVTHVVPEYNELNNTDSIVVHP